MSNWEWKQGGLYDGDVEILWVTQDNAGALYLGVMADYEDAIKGLPDLIAENRNLREALQCIIYASAPAPCPSALSYCNNIARQALEKQQILPTP